jgi:very-short-patch-repair endonuclease
MIHNYEFEGKLDDIVLHNSWCPLCATPSEADLFMKLREKYPNVAHQYRTPWCKSDRELPFDFALEDQKIIIELDGPQHFRQISNWEPPEVCQERDMYKMECAATAGFSIIRVAQQDLDRLIDELFANIEKITGSEKPTKIFMCSNGEYSTWSECAANTAAS